MTWIKGMHVFEEDGKFKLADRAGLYTLVFPSYEVRQWWIDNYYRKIGVVEFVEGKPTKVMTQGEVIAVVVKDSVLRDFVSRLVAYQYGGSDSLLDCDLTGSFCKRLVENPSELVGRVFIWELPLPARPLRYYEWAFIARVLSAAYRLPCVLIVSARKGYLPKVIKHVSTQWVEAVLRCSVLSTPYVDYLCYDKRTKFVQRCQIPLVEEAK